MYIRKNNWSHHVNDLWLINNYFLELDAYKQEAESQTVQSICAKICLRAWLLLLESHAFSWGTEKG